jgi:tetratricopeptide (TPR) repeat protein
MKALLVITLLCSTAFAESKTKRAPDKFMKAAGDAFAAAAEADGKGDLRTALGLYEKAHAISPHSSTIYNIADVQRRLSHLRQAIKAYETYLVMSPQAKDRADVEALLEQLAKTPGTLLVFTTEASNRDSVDIASGIVLVDGEIKRRPAPMPEPPHPNMRRQLSLQVPPGKHVVDLVTPITYATDDCEVEPGGNAYCELRADPRLDGNTVISASDRMIDVKPSRKDKDLVYKRAELPAGKQRLVVKDRNFGCAPLALDVAADANTITYAFLKTTEYEFKRCRTLDIKRQRLQFEP